MMWLNNGEEITPIDSFELHTKLSIGKQVKVLIVYTSLISITP